MSALRNAFEEMLRAEVEAEDLQKTVERDFSPELNEIFGPQITTYPELEEVLENDNGHPLREAFEAAILQATKGKGERHGGDATPFFDQPWYSIAKQVGVGGLIFQSMKKAGEACGKPDQETFERELLGAIVYAGMAYLYVQIHGFKPENKV